MAGGEQKRDTCTEFITILILYRYITQPYSSFISVYTSHSEEAKQQLHRAKHLFHHQPNAQ